MSKKRRTETVTISLIITKKQHQWLRDHPEYNVSAVVRKKLDDFIQEQMQRKE